LSRRIKSIRADSEAGPYPECQPPTGKDMISIHLAHVGRTRSAADSEADHSTFSCYYTAYNLAKMVPPQKNKIKIS